MKKHNGVVLTFHLCLHACLSCAPFVSLYVCICLLVLCFFMLFVLFSFFLFAFCCFDVVSFFMRVIVILVCLFGFSFWRLSGALLPCFYVFCCSLLLFHLLFLCFLGLLLLLLLFVVAFFSFSLKNHQR